MFLRSLTLKGFKSFADKTVLDVEPGITVIVGPNGSGKSNVVDALGWVLGTHSARKMRSGQMSDVIFAGSPKRPSLGRAMVEIAIDNSAGQLGLEGLGTAGSAQQFSEVRVSREIFASGENMYRINGEEVRALDVQELLSDTGLGREMHTIVGQGQLDAILNAKPEDRRAYIEEAAGISKHRRRRERAIKKLAQVDVHIDKLKTVLRELRRQLRPLERQAEAANKYAAIQAELRDVQVRIATHDLARLRLRRDAGSADDRAAATEQEAAEQALAEGRAHESEFAKQLAQHTPKHERAQADFYRLRNLLERLRGTGDLIDAKRRHLIEYVEEPLAGRPPDELRAQADRVAVERDERGVTRDAARQTFEAAVAARREAEGARRAHEQKIAAEARRRAEQRERVLRWEGEVSALRGSIAAAEAETGRIAAQLTGLDGRIAEADADVQKVQDEIQGYDVAEVDLTEAVESAEAELVAAEAAHQSLVDQERVLERDRAAQAGRAEALRAALAEDGSGTAALLEADVPGVMGHLADHVRVASEDAGAVAAALGPLGEAVLADDVIGAGAAVNWLRANTAGRAAVLPGRDVTSSAPSQAAINGGAAPLGDVISSRGDAAGDRAVAGLRAALATTYIASDWGTAVRLHTQFPELTFVTRDGDVAGPAGFIGGSAGERSALVTASAADEAEANVATIQAELAKLTTALEASRDRLVISRKVVHEATAKINESDAQITGAAERLARVHKELVGLRNQREVVARQHEELGVLVERDAASLQAMLGRGPDASEPVDEELPDDDAAELDLRVEDCREAELESRVTLERLEEQMRHLESQIAALRGEADEVERALVEAARRREARRAGITRCGDLAAMCKLAIDSLEGAIAEAAKERDALQKAIEVARGKRTEVRLQIEDLAGALEVVREKRHAADLQRAELDRDVIEVERKLRHEFSMDPDEALAEHPGAMDADRDAMAEREDVLVRKLGLLGRINPLALEEFKALEDRHAFLSEQLDDLRKSKRDLAEIIETVDDKIRVVFAEAFADVAQNFEDIFGRVFPGGHGKLVLTDPDDMLVTGIEVEARPPGKRVKRLSLLSGGERSLTVLAFVFAIFKARPSPFYVLDEVDAALDDVNLTRLTSVIEDFKGTSQLIIVTHQRRTMEMADVLYGVTMGPDAVTKVLTERIDEGRFAELAAAEA